MCATNNTLKLLFIIIGNVEKYKQRQIIYLFFSLNLDKTLKMVKSTAQRFTTSLHFYFLKRFQNEYIFTFSIQ